MEKSLDRQYAQIQIAKWIQKNKVNPISVISMLLNESRLEERTRLATEICEDVPSMAIITGMSERALYRRLEKLDINFYIKKDHYKTKQE